MTSHSKSKRTASIQLILLPLLFSACTTTPEFELTSNEACFRGVAAALAGDEMKGRGQGSEGLQKAGNYIGRAYRALGLEAVRTAGFVPSYRQPFRAVTGVKAGPNNRLEFEETNSPGVPQATFRTDFRPFGFSGSNSFSGEVVFVGYGIVAEPLGYDDFAGIDVKDKVLLAMRYEPGEADPESPFDGKRPSRYSDLRYKALKAREAGAAALIFTTPPGDDDEDRLPRMIRSGPLSDAGIPVLQIKRELARQLLANAGHDLDALHAAIDADYQPHSHPLLGLVASGTTNVVTRHTVLQNIVGIVPGQGALADEAVVVGAHFDHLGLGGASSLGETEGAIHNGADDNASGVAAMICGVGRAIERLEGDTAPRRSLIVAGFSGEEAGLLGSAFYVGNAVFPIEKTVAMVNLDMVGRLREEKLHALGADSSKGWKPILVPLAERHGFDLSAGGDGYGPSDQMSFFGAGVPVIHFFTGTHGEYHTPQDDIALLNTSGGSRIADYLSDVLVTLVHDPESLVYEASTNKFSMAGDARGFGAYLGSIPDYTEMMNREGGVLLSGVRGGGPADVAGIASGDRIVKMDGTEIHNLHDMTFVLRDHRPGDVIDVKFLRDENPMVVKVTLSKRGKRKDKKPAQKAETDADPHSAADPHAAPD